MHVHHTTSGQEGVERHWCSCMMILAHALVHAQGTRAGRRVRTGSPASLMQGPRGNHAGVRLWRRESRVCAVQSARDNKEEAVAAAGRCSTSTAGGAPAKLR
jgi:hypothetical protein